jgi:hypothetical protein
MADEQKDPYLEVMREVVTTKQERGAMYRMEPKDIVPVEVLESMLLYKVTREYYANDPAKKRDELIDTINYAAFIIMRMDLDAKVIPHIQAAIKRADAKRKDPVANAEK